MARVKWFCAALVGAMVLAGPAWAQEVAGERSGGPPSKVRRPRRGQREMLEQLYETLVRELELNADQQAAVKQAVETYAQDVKNWVNEHGEELKALREQVVKARKAGEKEALKGLWQKYRALGRQRWELRAKMEKQILALLNDDQKAKFKKLLQVMRRGGPLTAFRKALRRLRLEEEQTARAEKILKAAEQDAKKATQAKDKQAIIDKAIEQVKNTVLSPEQRARLARLLRTRRRGRGRGLGPLGRLNLTEDQRRQVQAIFAAARQAEPGQRRQARRDAWKKVVETVLTEEQRQKLQQMRQRRRGGGRKRGQSTEAGEGVRD